MKGEKVYPFIERSDYSLPAWTHDLINIIKKRGFLLKKEDAFLVFVENSDEFMRDYCEGLSPMEAYNEFVEDIKE